MATSTPLAATASVSSGTAQSPSIIALPAKTRSPLIYWHLLSLDAPTVAMLWTWFIAAANKVHLPYVSILAMGIAVWLLYAVDRLLDARREGNLEHRHHFHRRHKRLFRAGILATTLALAVLVPRLPRQSLHLYSVLGTLLLAYFALIHLQRTVAPRLPKEIAVGIFFSAATFIPAVARNPALRAPLLPAAILFGLTCSLNCLFIYAWEHPAPFPEAHPATRLALRLLRTLACLTALGGATLALRPGCWQLPSAVALAAALLLLLHVNRRHLNPGTLRAAADLCLLTPVVFALTLR